MPVGGKRSGGAPAGVERPAASRSAAAAGPKLPPREKGMAAPSRAGKGPRREKGTATRACSAAATAGAVYRSHLVFERL